MKKLTRAQLAIGVISMISVYLITCQLNSVKINANIQSPEKLRVEDLQAQITLEKEKNSDLLTQLMESERSLENYRSESTSTSVLNAALKKELDTSRVLAGVTEVSGLGISVILNDSIKPATEITGGNYEEYIIHDGDLRMVLTELAGAGAEAISINEQRIIGTTAVRCVGNTIMVNDIKIAPPFEIKAIGDPNTLDAALMIKGGVSDYLKSWNINMVIKKPTTVTIPRYSGIVNFRYATPVIDEGAATK